MLLPPAPGETQYRLPTLLLVCNWPCLTGALVSSPPMMLNPTHTAPHRCLQAQQQVAQVAHALLVVRAGPHGAGQDLLCVEPHHLRHRLAAEAPLG